MLSKISSRAFVALIMLVVPTNLANANEQMFVTADQTKLVKFNADVSEVIIANPSIADVTVLYNDMIAITGKTHGTTNLIVQDRDRQVILDTLVSVQPMEGFTTVMRGMVQTRYVCSGTCEVALAPDSGKEFPCESPDDRASDGSRCGGRSAFDKEGGRAGEPPRSAAP